MKDGEFVSGTFILPPKADHVGLLSEFEAVALNQATHVRGCRVSSIEAKSVVTLYHGLTKTMRDSLMARTIPDMVAATMRCRELSESDPSWNMFEHKRVG